MAHRERKKSYPKAGPLDIIQVSVDMEFNSQTGTRVAGLMAVSAELYGKHFAIHASISEQNMREFLEHNPRFSLGLFVPNGPGFAVTHKRTGRRLLLCRYKYQARQAIKEIEALDFDWSQDFNCEGKMPLSLRPKLMPILKHYGLSRHQYWLLK